MISKTFALPCRPQQSDIEVGLLLGLVCSRASDYGLMKIDDKGRVLYFNEKPKGADLESMVCLVNLNFQEVT
jgi:ADP-glucose pyrophosphorylase